MQIDLPADLPPAMAERRRIVQVLNNLLSNAAGHSRAFRQHTLWATSPQ